MSSRRKRNRRKRNIEERETASATMSWCFLFFKKSRPRLRPPCAGACSSRLPSPAPHGGAYPRLHGLQNRHFPLLPPPVAPHPDVDLVQTTSFSVVGPAVGGCSGRREGTEAVRYGRVRVASEEAWDHRNPTQNILDMADSVWQHNSGRSRRAWAHFASA